MGNEDHDLIAIGAGVAGCACAYIAAKLGLKTLLVEQKNYLGGLVTGGLVVPAMKSENKGLNTEFFEDLIICAKSFNAQITYGDGNPGWFNPIKLKMVLEHMLRDAGVNILFESNPKKFSAKKNEVNAKIIESIEISDEMLSLPYYSKYFVDGTGNGNFSKLLNCEFWHDEKQKQPASLRFILSNVNLKEFMDFILNLDTDRETTTAYEIDGQIHLSTAYTWDSSQKWALAPYFERAVSENILKPTDCAYFQLFTIAGMNNSVAFNCPRILQNQDLGQFALSEGLIEARRAILRITEFCKTYLRGFKDAEIVSIADMTGYRESGRVKCRYDYTVDDIIYQKEHAEPALMSDYPIDIHSNTKDDSTLRKVAPYTLPLSSLMSKDYSNLYVAGRCLGADFKAQAALRVQTNCMSMGEAVARDIYKKIRAI